MSIDNKLIIPFKWEELNRSDDNRSITYRSKVIGGWVINNFTYSTSCMCESMVFIPDPIYQWEIKQELK